MQDLLVCACAVQCTDGTFCNRFVTRTPVITHIYIYTLFLYVCQSVHSKNSLVYFTQNGKLYHSESGF